ncbi:ankyrin repeat [Fusarium mundagurra]|uniref:Ankyrin repeat n=1 Tax=Fusarium mundagurra TaxID=1567541 RepID=A0A8H6DDR9_9HYPO|nr:ankyrin repeat [Fusarium mundagurra]
MLDQRHAGLPKPPNDNNMYTLGSVGKHNVVIACLPKGKIGNVLAATVAINIISTFPSIKFCLMVGISGGIPPKVCLSDVVIPKYLKELEQKWPRLAPKYLKSDSLKDQLFKANYAYIYKSAADGTVCLIEDQEDEKSDAEDDCHFCDIDQTVKRKPREVQVHYRLIASRNEVIKDSIFRNKLNRDLGSQVLCVEMEAAGLAHNFLSITIRGICDYADLHKNNAWKAYAAAVAAAFAKELLNQVQASDVGREPTAKEIVSQIHETVLQSDANIREVKRKMDRVEDVEILEWLTPVNYGPQQSDNFSQRQEGTGEWLLSSKEFQDWVETGKTLFCPGVPGAGKTIITSIVINELTTRFGDDDTVGIAYIYANYRQHDEQKVDHLLKSLLKQLVQGQSSMPASVKSLYDKHKVNKTRASVEEVSATIQSIDGLYSRIFIVIDALDELKETDSCRNRFLKEIFKFQAQCCVKFFATSRFIPEITDKFEGIATVNIRAQDEDVRGFLDGKISQSGQLLRTHCEMIKTEIAKTVDGMFLLAQLHLDSVSTKLTLKQIKIALNNLSSGPKAYDVAYKKAMERISGQEQNSKKLAMQVLSWITCAKRVLTISELQHALAVEENDTDLDKENLYRIEDMVSVCSGLVTIDEESGIIRLVHYTTQEYLDRTRDKWFSDAESEITMACIRYLSFNVFKSGLCRSREDYSHRLRCYPFYDYAHRNWGHHALMTCMDGDDVILDFLESPVKQSASIHAILVSEYLNPIMGHIQGISHMATEVPTAAYFGLSKTVLALLEKGHPADSKGMLGWTPLTYAARYGRGDVVKLLVARDDVDPNSNDKLCGETPISWAAKYGHAAVVKVLLEDERVLANCTEREDRTPLSFAAENGNLEVVKLLLSRYDVDPNSIPRWEKKTPLHYAAVNGYSAIVKLILERKGVLADYMDNKDQTPLLLAAESGHEAVVRLLLSRHDGSPNSTLWWSKTPLHYAAEKGHIAVVKQILEKKGVRVDYTDNKGQTPLSLATENGHEAVVRLLLAMGTVDVNRQSRHDESTLLD